ncbi:MAG: Cgl0159 family (beta/alpha)8-fold protein [Promethearchaeota archaeon]
MALEDNIKSLVHFMAYPGPRLGRSTQLGEAPEKYLLESIEAVAKDGFFNGLEITLIKDPDIRAKVASLLKKHKFYVTFSAQPIQLINEDNLIAPTDISSVNELERRNAVDRLKLHIDEAFEYNSSQFSFLSGEDPGTASGLRERGQATRSLIRSICELVEYGDMRAKQLKRKPMLFTLEMFDREEGQNMKGCLVGPSNEARLIAEEIKVDNDHPNFGLMYDLSHMFFLKNGFDHETPEVLYDLAPYLNWVHIANSVMDKTDPNYGDTHVSMDYPNGTVTPEVLADFVRVLNEVDFKGGVGFEIMPHGRQLSESVINIAKSMFVEATQQISVNYALGRYRFKTRHFFPEKLFFRITEAKISNPEIILEQAKKRSRRANLIGSNLLIIAADHPGRYVTQVGSDPIGMGDRQQYLGRIIRTLMADGVDGVMATPDIIDDIFVVNHFFEEAGGESFLDDKVLIGCTNRGGLSGSMFEMDDRVTAYTVKDIQKYNLDGAKMMFRLDLETTMSRYSQYTVERCAKMVRECNELHVPAFIEPLTVVQTKEGYQVKMNADDLIKTIGVATALGGSSANLWLKIPYVPNFEYVARSTSNPILMLGGASTGDPCDVIENFEKGMGAGANIRGALVGRNLLFPGYDDPRAVALAVHKIVHEYENAEEAVKFLASERGKDMDILTRTIFGQPT